MRDVVVLVPGIMGSVLRKDGKDLWAPSGSSILAALTTFGRSLDALRLDKDSLDADVLDDRVQATRLFPDTHLIPGLWKIDGYTATREYLFAHFDLVEGANYFEFPYDWRRDNRAAAVRLSRLCAGWLAAWRKQTRDDSAKLLFVAHSMGGLVSLHYLERLNGWRDTRMLITLGTPFRGSLKAANFLSNGITGPAATLPVADIAALVRTFTSVYQLLPRFPCVRADGGEWKRIAEVSTIPGINQLRAKGALQFHHELDKAMQENRQRSDFTSAAYRLHPFVGTFQDTAWSGRLSNGRLEVSSEVPTSGPTGPGDGDGTVPRISAQPIGSSSRDTTIAPLHTFCQLHASLQRDGAVLTQLEGLLANDETLLSGFRDDAVKVSLNVQDIYESGAPVLLRAHASVEGALLEAKVTTRFGGSVAATITPMKDMGQGVVWSIANMPPGEYRVVVQTTDALRVSDVFVVV